MDNIIITLNVSGKKKDITLDITDEDIKDLKEGTVDIYTFSYYSSNCTTGYDVEKTDRGNISLGIKNPKLTFSEWVWALDPTRLRYYLNEIYGRYQMPVMVAENGLGAVDELTMDMVDNITIGNCFASEEELKALQEANTSVIEFNVNLVENLPQSMKDRLNLQLSRRNDINEYLIRSLESRLIRAEHLHLIQLILKKVMC